MKCLVNWDLLRIRIGSRNTQSHLRTKLIFKYNFFCPQPFTIVVQICSVKVGLGISRTSADLVESSLQGISSNLLL